MNFPIIHPKPPYPPPPPPYTPTHPHFFNKAFERQISAMQRQRRLRALRVLIGGDLVARVPFRALGCVPGIRNRLLLHPADEEAPLRYSEVKPNPSPPP